MNHQRFAILFMLLESATFSCGGGAASASTDRAPATTAPTVTPPAPAPKVEAPQPSAADDTPKAAGACAFTAPTSFANLSSKWEGSCKNGKAHGRGVLRGYEGKRVVKFFFGSMNNGKPKYGVVEDEGGYAYGEFKDGKLVDPPDPAENGGVDPRVGAFEEAIAAAKQVSESFKAAGNAGSADFYAAKVKKLEMQLE